VIAPRAMPSIPIRAEYGPTLGQLSSSRWRASSPLLRLAVRAGALALLALAIGATLALLNSSFSSDRPRPFSFAYRGLYRTTPDAGGIVKVVRRRGDGSLLDSFAVAPLRLPPYSGRLSGELPVFASGYIEGLERRLKDFALYGEGRTRVNAVPAYDVSYSATVDGRRTFGRDVLLLAPGAGQREGVEITMLTAPDANKKVDSPLEVANTGVLLKPLKTFTLH
jgi:hypothetical protein